MPAAPVRSDLQLLGSAQVVDPILNDTLQSSGIYLQVSK